MSSSTKVKRVSGGRPLFNFRLAPEDASRLDLVRRDLGLTRSEVMRLALRQYLDEFPQEQQEAPQAS